LDLMNYKVGKIYPAEVRKITDYGVFLSLEDGLEGLCHQSELSHDENEVEGLCEIQKSCLIISGVVIVAIMLGAIFGGDDDDSGKNSNDRSPIRIGGGDGKDDPTGPRIYRYKVTINLNDLDADNTKIRVSASGEIEQDGKILSTGGIHELEFFQQFFANVNKALFLEDQGQ